ncbi:MAG: hypothetical protein JRM78_01920 [Nitrososphaerota archaeon]|nr:hypothetical protein [Nitrososphaerota archaeon]MDG7048334.1 hypothetical protein [Nitrososphaerota archaeon]
MFKYLGDPFHCGQSDELVGPRNVAVIIYHAQADVILQFLSGLNKNGHTIIVITHDMTFVARFCRRAIVVNRGKIVLDGTVKDVFNATEELEATNIKPNDTALIGKKLQRFGKFVSVNDIVGSG